MNQDDDVAILRVTRRGEWYQVDGLYRGLRVLVDVHASREEAEGPAAFARAVRAVGRAELDGAALLR